MSNHEHDTDTITKRTKVPIASFVIVALVIGAWTDLANEAHTTDKELVDFIQSQNEVNKSLLQEIQTDERKQWGDEGDLRQWKQMVNDRLNIKLDP